MIGMYEFKIKDLQVVSSVEKKRVQFIKVK